MKKSFVAPILAVALLGSTARAEKQLDGMQAHQGFALELHLGSRLFNIAGIGNTISIGALQGGFMAGYKIGRFLFGLGFDISRVATSMSQPGQDTSTADTAILFTPGIRVAIVRSSDQRVELFGQFDLGLGHTFHDETPTPAGPQPDTSNFHLLYKLGPGVRYWVHPQFAFSGLAALEGEFQFNSSTLANVTTKNSTGLTSIAAELALLGVF